VFYKLTVCGAGGGEGAGKEEATESSSLFLYHECERKVRTRVASLGIQGRGDSVLIDALTFMGCFV